MTEAWRSVDDDDDDDDPPSCCLPNESKMYGQSPLGVDLVPNVAVVLTSKNSELTLFLAR